MEDKVSDGVEDKMMEENEHGVDNKEDKEDDPKVQMITEMTPGRIWKNIIVMSIVFLLLFLSFSGLAMLQSSLHQFQGLGTMSHSILYVAMVISCLLLPKLATETLGYKRCINFSILGYILWMAVNGYARWWTMVPASIIVGICAGPIWIAQKSYFTIMGKEYARLKNQKLDATIGQFFGIFFMIFQVSLLCGSIVSSTVLYKVASENYTAPSDDELALCGINDCPRNTWRSPNATVQNINLKKPDDKLVWALVGIYIFLACLGLILSVVGIDDIPAHLLATPEAKNAGKTSMVIADLKATFVQMFRPMQLLLIPVTIYLGMNQGFKFADWSKSYVTCNIGIWMIGLTFIPFAICSGFTSFIAGKVAKKTGRFPIIITATCIELSLICVYIFWIPDPSKPAIFFIVSALIGTSDAMWVTQLNTLYGFVFIEHKEAAFSNFHLWKAMGYIIQFGYSSYICTSLKVYILLGLLVVAMLLYGAMEWMLRKRNAQQANTDAKHQLDQLDALDMTVNLKAQDT